MNIAILPLSLSGVFQSGASTSADLQFETVMQDCAFVPTAIEISSPNPCDIQKKDVSTNGNIGGCPPVGYLPVAAPDSIPANAVGPDNPESPSAEIVPLLSTVQHLASLPVENTGVEHQPDTTLPEDSPSTDPRAECYNNSQVAPLPIGPNIDEEAHTLSAPPNIIGTADRVAAPRQAGPVRLQNSNAELMESITGGTIVGNEVAKQTTIPTFQLPPTVSISSLPTESMRRSEVPTLDLFKNTLWLDTLARDIAASFAGDGKLQFRLVPDFLGTLDIGLVQENDRVDIHLETSTEAAGRIIAAEHPKLLNELHQSGLKIGSFEMNGGQQSNAQRQQHQPPARTVTQPHAEIQTLKKRNGRFA